jgi:hypothetical protein
VRSREAASPDDPSDRRENHEAPPVASSFETRLTPLLRMRGWSRS